MAELCSPQSSSCFDDLELQEVISEGSLDFDEWTTLISKIETIYPDDVEKICLVFDNFLSKFPLCYGYWRKYAVHMTHLSTIDKVVEIFERAVASATYSVDMWVDYCSFCMSAFEDPSDIRRLFERAFSFVGKDYLCHALWGKYIHFEFSQQQWTRLAHIYIQTLKFPTTKLHQYYDSFKKLITVLEEDMASQGNSTKESQSECLLDCDVLSLKDDEVYCIIKDMVDSTIGSKRLTALKKYRKFGEQLYRDACQLDLKISSFETNIRRSYFHVRPLDASQLQIWHHYLDFVELQGDFDWAVKLYERCLIVCANYPEYWMRYVDFMETKGGREIANYSLERATEIFLKRVRAIHLFNARFKEQIGDISAARAAYIQSGAETDSEFLKTVISKANMEKRLGNMEAAFNIYKEALEMAAAKKLHTLPILYVHFSRLKYMVGVLSEVKTFSLRIDWFTSTNSMDAARDVLTEGIRNLPQSKLLLEELIKLSMAQGCPKNVAAIDSVIAHAISPRQDGSQGLSVKDAEDVSNLYLEFVDYCGTVHDVTNAWNRHMKLFPGFMGIDIHQQSDKCRTLMNLIKDKGEKTSVAIPDSQDAGVALQESHSAEPDDAIGYKLQVMEVDDSAQGERRELALRVSEESRENNAEQNVSSADLVAVKEVSPKVPKNFVKEFSEPDVSSENLQHQVTSEKEILQASQANTKESNVSSQEKYGDESEVKPLSLGSHSLKPQESTCPDSVPMTSNECESIPESHKSNNRPVDGDSNPNRDHSESAQDLEPPQTHVEINSPSSSVSHHHDQGARRPLLQPRYSRNSGGNRHQMGNAGKFRRGPKYGYHGHGYRKQHQRQLLSPQNCRPAEGGIQMPKTSSYPSQTPLQIQQGSQGQNPDFVAAHSWPMQNVPLQNSASQSQPPAAHTTSQQEQSQQFQQQSQPENIQSQELQQVFLQHQQQHFQQHLPLQQEIPVYPQQQQPSSQLQQSDQEQKQYNQSTTSPHSQSLDYSHYQQGQLQHSSEAELVSSSVPTHPLEKSSQGE
ncbi:Pre-mRNA-processing factor 39 [Senna tora]|uniref:Pre-mRNA-processing factor 39 n=1 Tax=Senna tora TaxID=362788 RepID=A0A835CHQ0_9FABA|nr:Pre-mRNA-processing factor 39 [Senna tora]